MSAGLISERRFPHGRAVALFDSAPELYPVLPSGTAPLLVLDPSKMSGTSGNLVAGGTWALGADTAAPTLNAGPPASIQFSSTSQYVTLGDAIDAVLASAAGFTFVQAINPSATDITVNRTIWNKDSAVNGGREVYVALTAGKLDCFALYGGGAPATERKTATTALTAGRHTVAGSFDPTQATRANRWSLFADGAAAAATAVQSAVDGTISDTSTEIHVGARKASDGQGVESGMLLIYPGVLDSADVSAAHAWIVAKRGWS